MYPYEQLKFQQAMLSGLPVSAVTNTPGQMSDLGSLLSALGGAGSIASAGGYGNVGDLLKDLYSGYSGLTKHPEAATSIGDEVASYFTGP